MRFAHISDCHLGSWNNHPELEKMPNSAFTKAVDMCISENVDFVLIAGDLFNTSLPPIDALSNTTFNLKKLKDAGIPVYVIAGSHDFSPSHNDQAHLPGPPASAWCRAKP
ncbi:MAG: metallophosphoesterase [Candidatus Hydrogenedentes bacterium]|nr:metallophosphoesterase [Candidatus Hydrogenedentota bacterium]